jgi:ectoine hydroxylase-related dioxygenase (phytanoyl-CoA dioxygenase family)
MTQTIDHNRSPQAVARPALSRAEMDQLKKAFAENGYVVIKNVVPKDRLAALHARLMDEFEQAKRSGRLFAGGGQVSGHLNCFPGAEARFAYEALKDAGVVDFIREISPKSVREPNVGCNFNLPGSVTQHYHMDRTYTNEFMIANVTVVDTTIENGATDVIPGTHRKFYKFWRFALERPWRNRVRVESNAGDVVVRVSNLWHRGMPNHSTQARPMLAYTWEDGGSVYDDPFTVDGGQIAFRPNWFRPTRLGRLRERVFVTAPITYATYRFVDSLFTNKGYA